MEIHRAIFRIIGAYLDFFYSSRTAPFIFWIVVASTLVSLVFLWLGAAIESSWMISIGFALAIPLFVTYVPWLAVTYLMYLYLIVVALVIWPIRDAFMKKQDRVMGAPGDAGEVNQP